ncbi:MAG: agmatinase [Lentisphaeria bacterium]|jgi:agmatinase
MRTFSSEYPAFLQSDVLPPPPDQARFHVLPVPYEKTVSYGRGTAGGPNAILKASQQLEVFDGEGMPALAGIHTLPPVECVGTEEVVLRRIYDAVHRILTHRALPVVLGGEHTVTYPTLAALLEFYPHGSFGVVQFDAHADLRDEYQGSKWSHACVMRRALELQLPIFQLGVRSLTAEEDELRRQEGIGHFDARHWAEHGLPERPLPAGFPPNLFISFDIDAFDPSLVPGTGTPEPGGFLWWDVVKLLRRVIAGRQVVGFDIVEVAPVAGMRTSEFTAAKLAYLIMGLCPPREVIPLADVLA